MNDKIYEQIPYYGHSSSYCPYYRQSLFYCPYCFPGSTAAQPYVCPYLNQTRYPEGPFVPKPKIPFPPDVVLSPELRAKKTIETKWETLNREPGTAISDVERVGIGYRIRYQNGSIYTKKPAGPAWWIYGAIGVSYEKLGGVRSWLGFPTSDELPLRYDDGRVSSFEQGEIYWWPDTGAIEIDKVVLAYSGINCFGETDQDDFLGVGSDEVYATISVVAPTGNAGEPVEFGTSLTRLYTDVDGGESVPDHIELYRGKPYGLNITFVLIEHDQEDPVAYYKAIEAAVSSSASTLASGLGAVSGTAAAALAGPILQGLVPIVSKQINTIVGAGPDVIGTTTMTLTAKQVVLLAARTGESTEKQINFNLTTQLLTGEGSSYKGYFRFYRA